MSYLRIAAQLYTVRNLTAADFSGALGQVAATGYRNVELAGFGNLNSAGEAKQALDDRGLSCISVHIPVESFEGNFEQVLRDAELIGSRALVIPWLVEERRRSRDDWRQFAEFLNETGEQCHRRGFELAYHNHAFEFDQFAGQRGFDILWNAADPRFVKAELDVYWVAFANEDPVAWMRRLSDRLLLLHLKDMANTPDRRFAEVGAGVLDFAGILQTAESIRVKWGIVEQDDCYGQSPIACLKTSFETLERLLSS